MEPLAFLHERVSRDFQPETRAENTAEIEKRLAEWRENCSRGDQAIFRKRLQWDGLDENRVRGLVGRVRRTTSELPTLVLRLLRCMVECSQAPWNDSERKNDLAGIRGKQPAAFEGFSRPLPPRLARRIPLEQNRSGLFPAGGSGASTVGAIPAGFFGSDRGRDSGAGICGLLRFAATLPGRRSIRVRSAARRRLPATL